MEVLLHGGTRLAGWRTPQIHQAVLSASALPPSRYGLNQLRYDLRKLRAHALLERDGQHNAYRLTDQGVKVAVLFVLFHQRLCHPSAHSLFHHQPDHTLVPNTKLGAAFHKADNSIREIVQLLEAA